MDDPKLTLGYRLIPLLKSFFVYKADIFHQQEMKNLILSYEKFQTTSKNDFLLLINNQGSRK